MTANASTAFRPALPCSPSPTRVLRSNFQPRRDSDQCTKEAANGHEASRLSDSLPGAAAGLLRMRRRLCACEEVRLRARAKHGLRIWLRAAPCRAACRRGRLRHLEVASEGPSSSFLVLGLLGLLVIFCTRITRITRIFCARITFLFKLLP